MPAHEIVEAAKAVPVTVTSSPGIHIGFLGVDIPYAFLTASGMWTLLGTIVIAVIKLKPRMRELKIDGEEKLREDMRLEREADRLRIAALEKSVEHMREYYEGKLDVKETQHQQEISKMRHKLSNLDMCFQSLLIMIEMNPDDPEKVREAAKRARQMRETQQQRESEESATMASSRASDALDRMAATEGSI